MTVTDWGNTAGAGFEGFEISNRDLALFLIRERDLNAQLIALKGVLRRNRDAKELVAEEIKALDTHIRANAGESEEYRQHMEDQWVESLHGTVFQDAAHSMSAVGMLAPFVEALFVSIFRGLRERSQGGATADPRAMTAQDQYWNPRIVFDKDGPRGDIVAGIVQLATSTSLQSLLPEGYQKTLSALFAYRNNMFHNGFEWPPEVRQKFATRIKNDNWPGTWFSWATSGGEPWVFYMREEFIAHCLEMTEQILSSVGRYISESEPKPELASNNGEK